MALLDAQKLDLQHRLGFYAHKNMTEKVYKWTTESKYAWQTKSGHAFREAVQAYEKAKGVQLYWPDNETLVFEYIATQRFGFSSGQALTDRDESLASKIDFAISTEVEWRGWRICTSEFDEKYTVARAGNMIYKGIEDRLTEAQKAYKQEAYKANYKIWDEAELIAAIVAFLKENKSGEFSQDEIASELEAKSTYVFQLLEKKICTDTKHGVITYKGNRHKNDKHAGKRQVFKFSPMRIALLASDDRDAFLSGRISYLLGKKPSISRLQVYKTLHMYFGQLDNKVVYRVLDQMVDQGKITCLPGVYDNARVCNLAL